MTSRAIGRKLPAGKLESRIYSIKYTLFCFNVVLWLFGVTILTFSLWILFDSELDEWTTKLEIGIYYLGIYFIFLAALVVVIVAFLGCGASLMENVKLLYIYIGTQGAIFLLGLIGSCVVLNYSTYDSSIQPMIRDAILRLINNPHHEGSMEVLKTIQERVGCCGADGAMDFIHLNKPLPNECRDSVTGNVYFHGCVDELTWFLESQTGWLVSTVLATCMICVINAVLSFVLVKAVKKEEEEVALYRN